MCAHDQSFGSKAKKLIQNTFLKQLHFAKNKKSLSNLRQEKKFRDFSLTWRKNNEFP